MHSFLRRPRRALRDHLQTRTRGQSLVELALILPVFMLFFAAILDLGRVAAAQIAVTNAAREGVFQAAQTPTDHDSTKSCPADGASNVIYCRIKLESTGANAVSIAPTDVTVSCNPVDCATGIGNTVSVRVIGHFRLLTPLMGVFFGGTQSITFTSTATANRETLPVDGLNTPAPTATATPTPTPTPTPTSTATSTATATATATPTPAPCTLPSAGFTFTVTGSPSNQAPQTVTVTDTSTSINCGLTSWFWTWGDGTTSDLKSPGSHTYVASNDSKSYSITLRVANAAGSNTSGAAVIQVK
ncbi:MAG: pilus assembly protein [Acidimicrobiia bacterium]|nr:pilus assembly protein [Acidimicrobiia bacterium]